MHPIVERAKQNLGIDDSRETSLEYSGRFGAFNGNVRADRYNIKLNLSKDWRGRDLDAQQGLVEHLLAKLFKVKGKTPRMHIYQEFLLYAGKENGKQEVEDETLRASFERVNKKYFSGEMEIPSIKWGRESFTKLGHYHFGSDTVLLSKILLENLNMLDFVMYHELLHKKHGLTKGGRAHTKAFRADEAKFEEASQQELENFVRKKKRRWF